MDHINIDKEFGYCVLCSVVPAAYINLSICRWIYENILLSLLEPGSHAMPNCNISSFLFLWIAKLLGMPLLCILLQYKCNSLYLLGALQHLLSSEGIASHQAMVCNPSRRWFTYIIFLFRFMVENAGNVLLDWSKPKSKPHILKNEYILVMYCSLKFILKHDDTVFSITILYNVSF